MKTVKDYLKDPRIINDPNMTNAINPIKEIQAIRLKIHDEKVRLGEIEYNKRLEVSLEEKGITLCRDLAGKGRITPTPAVVSRK
jgi:hypothetical protein